jgi:capsular polysaccharide biosynthesis protein
MELSILEIFNILLKRVWILLLATIVGLSGALLISLFLIAPTFTSTAVLYVNPNQNQLDRTGNYNDLNYAQELVNSYIIILKNDVFLKDVAEQSGLEYTSGQIRGMLSLASINSTEIFEVRISSKNPQHSFLLAETITDLAPEEIIRIKESDSVKLVSPAVLPTSPSAPNNTLNAIIGAVLGFAVAVASIILVEILDTRVKSEEDLATHYSLPILGSIPKYEEE